MSTLKGLCSLPIPKFLTAFEMRLKVDKLVSPKYTMFLNLLVRTGCREQRATRNGDQGEVGFDPFSGQHEITLRPDSQLLTLGGYICNELEKACRHF